jgi:hypothetical protein
MTRFHPRLALAGVAIAIALLATPATGGTSASPSVQTLPRSTADRTDDVSGPQVHLVYAIPSDGTDRALDTNGVISGTVAVWEDWLASQTGGRILRLDTYQGADDITFVRLPQTDAELAGADPYIRDRIEADLETSGLIVPGKIYAVYYDGASTYACGGGAWPPVLPGVVAALYLHGAPPGAPPCDTNQFHARGEAPGYLDFAMIHEIMHTLGFVPSCAPHFTLAGHVSDSPNDLLYAGPQNWYPMTLDVGHDDYFNAHIPGCPDLSDSLYLESFASVSVTTSGSGTVTSRPPGISCPTSCASTLGQPAQLVATPAKGETFKGWSGGCSGTGTCTLTAGGTVVATFAAGTHRRSLSLRIRASRAVGVLSVADGYRPCRAAVPVVVQRRGAATWTSVRHVRTRAAGSFAVSLPNGRGSYRAVAPEASVHGAQCAKATSPVARIG